MARTACVLLQQDEELLLRPWLLYHGYLFGFENLHVCDGGSSRDGVLATLREFSALGVRVNFAASADRVPNDDMRGAIDWAIDELTQDGRYEVALRLACNEFLAIDGHDGIACNRTAILDEIYRIHQDGVPCRMSHCLESQPGHLDLFRYVERSTDILLARAVATDSRDGPETHARILVDPEHSDGSTALIVVRLCVTPAELHDQHRPLLRFVGFVRLLESFTSLQTLREIREAGAPGLLPQNWLEVDLERHPFRGTDYLEANPDISRSGVNPLEHFLVAGYLEGRRMAATSAGLEEVLERMAAIRHRRPDGRSGYVGLTIALNALGRAAEGDPIIEQAIRQYGSTSELLREYASLAMVRQAHALAARRWSVFRCLFAAEPDGYHYSAVARRLNGDIDGADRILAAGLERFPRHVGLSLERADIVAERGDWTRAHSLYSAILAMEPGNPAVGERVSVAAFQLRLRQLETEDTHQLVLMDAPVNVVLSEADTRAVLEFLDLRNVGELRDFFLGFESLGHSCEFGLVQRRHGAEPLGLLRWNSIHAHKLIEALNERFAGIDEADNLMLSQAGDEYVLRDFRYHTAMHTFCRVNEATADTLLRQQVKRMMYLRSKLIADLEEGEKIFVHLDDRSLSQEDLARLRQAVRAYGESVLLYVRVAETPSQIGTLECVGDRLFLGYLDRLGRNEAGEWDISFDRWLTLCREVKRVLRFQAAPSNWSFRQTHPS
jgi:hypothetical protein